MSELRKISQEELNEILEKHRKWLNKEDGGERAILDYAILDYARLDNALLDYASLNHASLYYASLEYTSLDHVSLDYAILDYASLKDASLEYASIDYSAWPLWCGSINANVDDRITIQLLYHTLSASLQSKYVSTEIKGALIPLLPIANRFHRVDECREIQPDGTRKNITQKT